MLTATHMDNTCQEGNKAFITQPTFSATFFLEIKEPMWFHKAVSRRALRKRFQVNSKNSAPGGP